MRRATLILSLGGWLGLCLQGALAQDPPARPGRGGQGGQGTPGGRGFMASPVVTALDADGDGEVSAKELENATAALKTLDKDKDGKLSAAELRPALGRGAGGTEAMVARFMAFDKDNDGKVSKAELPERLQAMMDRGDANKDGFLDKEELAKLTPPTGRGGPGGAGGRGGRGGRGQQ